MGALEAPDVEELGRAYVRERPEGDLPGGRWSRHAVVDSPLERAGDEQARAAVLRFQAGDDGAFGELYRLYHGGVLAYLHAWLRDHHESEDLAQQVFAAVHAGLFSFELRADTPVRAWIFVIARNMLYRELKRRQRVVVHPPELVNAVREVADYNKLSALWLTDSTLDEALSCLPVLQQQVMMLRFMVELDYPEIASVLRITPEYARKLKSLAVGALNGTMSAAGVGQDLTRKRMAMWVRLRGLPVLANRRFALWSRGQAAFGR